MATKELKQKYGEGKTRGIINRAIGNELIGGNEVIDALSILETKQWNKANVGKAIDLLRQAKYDFELEIRRRYKMPVRNPTS